MFSVKVFLSSGQPSNIIFISCLMSSSSFVAFWRFKRVSSLIASSWVTPISPTCSSSVQKISSLWVFWFSGQMLPLKQLSKLYLTDDSPSVSSSQGRSSSSSALSFYSASLPSLGCRWCPWCGYYRRLDGYYMPCRVIQTGAHLMIRKTKTTTSLFV